MSKGLHKETALLLAKRFPISGIVGLFALLNGPVHALDIRAFSDIRFETTDQTDSATQFVLGGLDIFASQDIDDQTDVFFEYVIENDGTQFVTDLERLWVKREVTPYLAIAAGRFHTPLGYWNRSFHHGVLIQDTVSRPGFLDFEDGEGAVLPMHIIGVEGTGGFRVGGLELTYELIMGNAYSFNTDDSVNATPPGPGLEIGLRNVSDLSNDKTFAGRVTVAHDALPLELGLSAMSTSYIEAGTGNPAFGSIALGKSLVDQNVLGIDLQFSTETLNILTEFFNISNESQVPGVESTSAQAGYIQVAYRILPWFQPAYRYEIVQSIDDQDTYFQIIDAEEGIHHIAALRFDLDETNAVTLELDRHDQENAALEDYTEIRVDWSFLMF